MGFIAAVLAAFWVGVRFATPEPIDDAPVPEALDAPKAVVVTPTNANTTPDFPQTLAEILRISGDFAQTTALYVLASGADEPTLVRLLDEAVRIEQMSQRNAAVAILYERFADLAPASAVNDALQRGGGAVDRALVAIFHAWSRADLDAAVERAMQLPEPLRSQVGLAVLRARDDLGDDERRRIAADLRVAPAFEHMLAREAVGRWEDDPEAGWFAVLRMPESAERAQQLGAIALSWSRRDPEAALAAIAGLANGPVRRTLADAVARTWAGSDAESALSWALSHEDTVEHAHVLRQALVALGRSEPIRALDLATELRAPDERRITLSMILSPWAARDPLAAVAWFDEQRDPIVREAVVDEIARAYADSDWRSAVDWVSRLPPDDRSRAVPSVAIAMLDEDPERAGRLMLEQHGMQGVMQFANEWAEREPAAAAAWIIASVDEQSRDGLLGIVLPRLLGVDQPGALRLIERMPPGPAYDRTALVAIQVLRHDPAAQRLYEKISDPRMKAAAEEMLPNRAP